MASVAWMSSMSRWEIWERSGRARERNLRGEEEEEVWNSIRVRASRRVVEQKVEEVGWEEGRGEGEMEEGAGKRVLRGMRWRGGSKSTTDSDAPLGTM